MTRPLTQGEINSLVMEAFRPAADAAERMWGPKIAEQPGAWSFGFGWGCGAGRSLFDPPGHDGPLGVHVDGAQGRMRFYLPYDVARQVAERVAEDRPDVLARVRFEIADAHSDGPFDRDDEDWGDEPDETEELAA